MALRVGEMGKKNEREVERSVLCAILRQQHATTICRARQNQPEMRVSESEQKGRERGREINPLRRQCDISLLTLPLRHRALDPKARFKLNTQIFAYFIPGVLSAAEDGGEGRILLPARGSACQV